jgi:hypothetical protein
MDVGWEILSVLTPVICVSLLGLIVLYALSRARSDRNTPARLIDFAVHVMSEKILRWDWCGRHQADQVFLRTRYPASDERASDAQIDSAASIVPDQEEIQRRRDLARTLFNDFGAKLTTSRLRSWSDLIRLKIM